MYSLAKCQLAKGVSSVEGVPLPSVPMAAMLLVCAAFAAHVSGRAASTAIREGVGDWTYADLGKRAGEIGAALTKLGLECVPSDANFILVDVGRDASVQTAVFHANHVKVPFGHVFSLRVSHFDKLSVTPYHAFLIGDFGTKLFADGLVQVGAAGEDPFVQAAYLIGFQEL